MYLLLYIYIDEINNKNIIITESTRMTTDDDLVFFYKHRRTGRDRKEYYFRIL